MCSIYCVCLCQILKKDLKLRTKLNNVDSQTVQLNWMLSFFLFFGNKILSKFKYTMMMVQINLNILCEVNEIENMN